MAKSLVLAIAKAKLFPKLQLQAKLKTKLYLKTGLDWTKNCKLGDGGSLIVANNVSLPRECSIKKYFFRESLPSVWRI